MRTLPRRVRSWGERNAQARTVTPRACTVTLRRMFEAPTTAPMEIRDYLQILRRRAWVVVVVTLLTVGVAFAWSSARDETYTAAGEIVVGAGGDETDIATQARIVQSQAVHVLALGQLPSAPTVDATQDGESGGIRVEAQSADPATAAASVNAHVDSYVQYLRERALERYTAVVAEVQPEIDALQQRINALDAQPQVPASASVNNERTSLAAQLGALRTRLTDLQLEVAFAGEDVQVLRRALSRRVPLRSRNAKRCSSRSASGCSSECFQRFCSSSPTTPSGLARISSAWPAPTSPYSA